MCHFVKVMAGQHQTLQKNHNSTRNATTVHKKKFIIENMPSVDLGEKDTESLSEDESLELFIRSIEEGNRGF